MTHSGGMSRRWRAAQRTPARCLQYILSIRWSTMTNPVDPIEVLVCDAPFKEDTEFIINDNVLTQKISAEDSTVYPVVADPTVKVYPAYIRINLSKSESAAAISSTGACAAIFSKSPHPSGKAIAVGCGAIAAISAGQLSGGKCLSIHVAGVAPPFATWWPTFPKC